MPQSSWVKLIFHSWLKMNTALKKKSLTSRSFCLRGTSFWPLFCFCFFYSRFVLYVFCCFSSVFLVCFHLVCPLQKTCIKKVWYRKRLTTVQACPGFKTVIPNFHPSGVLYNVYNRVPLSLIPIPDLQYIPKITLHTTANCTRIPSGDWGRPAGYLA